MASAWVDSTIPNTISTLTTQHPTFQTEFSAFTTNADRVEFCLAEKVVQSWIGLFLSKFYSKQNGLKCPKTAAKHREEGNVCYVKVNATAENYEEAIKLYSTAICFAPQSVDTTELALAYGNRSAAYVRVGQHENALKDIDAALKFGYARFKPVNKLQDRKFNCLLKLGRSREACDYYSFIRQPTEVEKKGLEFFVELCHKNNDKKNESSKDEIPLIDKLTQKSLFKPNEKMPSLSTKVAVRYDAKKGRHLVAQEDIQFGDILGVSRPYVALFSTQKDALKCHHCCRDFYLEDMKTIAGLRPVPCANCSSVMFCSEKCRAKSSNSYHRYECGQHALLVQFSELYRMPLRILYRAGMDQIRAVVSAEQETDSIYFSAQSEDHYSHVYHLVHNSDSNVPYGQMLVRTLVACIMFHLAKLGHFPMNTKEDEKLIGGLLLRHLFQVRHNFIEHCLSTSSLFYPVFASLNHSCKENARLELPTNEYTCLLQAARPISAGTEITICYKNEPALRYEGYSKYRNICSKEKVKDLLNRYGFPCNCAQCKYQIRNMPFGESRYVSLGCSACGHLMELFSEQRSESQVFRCTNCPLEMNNVKVKKLYRQYFDLMQLVYYNYMKIDIQKLGQEQGDEQDSICKLIESTIEKVDSLVHRESAFATSYILYIISIRYRYWDQLDKWWAGIEQYLTITERLFGEESIEFMQEFGMIKNSNEFEKELNAKIMEDFKQQHNNLYERYLARLEQWKQLKLKYYADY